MERNRTGRAPKRRPGEVMIAEVLHAALDRASPGLDADRMESNRFARLKSTARGLVDFWGAKSVAEITPFAAREYAASAGPRRDLRKDSVGRRVSERTIISRLEMLRASVRAFAAERDLNWPPVDLGDIAHAPPRALEVATKSEVVRLLWAARGCTYEPGESEAPRASKGLKPSCFRPASADRVGQLRRMRADLARAILICFYSGSAQSCVVRLRWSGEPSGTESFVDLEKGVLYRLGPDAASGKAAGMPVPLCPRLADRLKRWHANARGARTYVIQSDRRGHAIGRIHEPFAAVATDAGFRAGEMTLSMVSNATGAELMRAGVSIRSAALYVGTLESTFAQRFERFRSDFHLAAREALQLRPKTVREMPAISVEWRARGRPG